MKTSQNNSNITKSANMSGAKPCYWFHGLNVNVWNDGQDDHQNDHQHGEQKQHKMSSG